MLDNELIQIFRPLIIAGLTARGFNGVSVVQAYQPTQQGINTGPTVYFFKVGDHRYGYLHRKDEWDPDEEKIIHTETQLYETTFQISALVTSNPSNINTYTASDLVNTVSAILQSDATLDALQDAGAPILRITDIRNPYFTDDRDRFEENPSFDFILIHEQVSITETPVIESIELDVKRI